MISDAIFLGRVSHDLRGELATIVAGVHYVLRYEPGLGPGARQMLERVSGAGQRLRGLLDELENAAWIDGAEARPLALEPCSARALVDGAVRRAAESLAGTGVSFAVDLPEARASFEGDPELLATALGYALDFAVARSPGKTLRVRGELEEGAPVVCISDEGGAVPLATRLTLLEPFVEKELIPRGARASRRDRFGLGLAIAAGILRAHGGAMSAEPGPGDTGVTLRLALARAAAPLRKLA